MVLFSAARSANSAASCTSALPCLSPRTRWGPSPSKSRTREHDHHRGEKDTNKTSSTGTASDFRHRRLGVAASKKTINYSSRLVLQFIISKDSSRLVALPVRQLRTFSPGGGSRCRLCCPARPGRSSWCWRRCSRESLHNNGSQKQPLSFSD